MPEVAPISRRSVLLGAGAVAATLALPQVSVAEEEVAIAVNWIPDWEIATGTQLDLWGHLYGLQRLRLWNATDSREPDAYFRQRIIHEILFEDRLADEAAISY